MWFKIRFKHTLEAYSSNNLFYLALIPASWIIQSKLENPEASKKDVSAFKMRAGPVFAQNLWTQGIIYLILDKVLTSLIFFPYLDENKGIRYERSG